MNIFIPISLIKNTYSQTEKEILDLTNVKKSVVLDVDNQHYMYYSFDKKTDDCSYSNIGLALSNDKNEWTISTNNPIFSGNCNKSEHSWNTPYWWGGVKYRNTRKTNQYTKLDFPYINYNNFDNIFRIWYTSHYYRFYYKFENAFYRSYSISESWQIKTSTSEDGINWNEDVNSTNIIFSDSCDSSNCNLSNPPKPIKIQKVEFDNDQYWMWHKRGDENWLSNSTDGIHFSEENRLNFEITHASTVTDFQPGQTIKVTLSLTNNGTMNNVAVTLNVAPHDDHDQIILTAISKMKILLFHLFQIRKQLLLNLRCLLMLEQGNSISWQRSEMPVGQMAMIQQSSMMSQGMKKTAVLVKGMSG